MCASWQTHYICWHVLKELSSAVICHVVVYISLQFWLQLFLLKYCLILNSVQSVYPLIKKQEIKSNLYKLRVSAKVTSLLIESVSGYKYDVKQVINMISKS